MKIMGRLLAYCCFSAWLLSSCGALGAGSHAYCESILVACPGDTLIKRLTLLKTSGRYDDARSFPDGPGEEPNAPHSFYFYNGEHKFLVHLEAPGHTPTTTALHIAGIRNFTRGSEWQSFNRDVSEAKKREVMAWFNGAIRPALAGCAKFKHP